MADKKLRDVWRAWSRSEREALAKEAGTTHEYLRMIFTNQKKPGALMAVRIDKATGGAVTAEQLRPDIFGRLVG